jgi:hypothetical protein
MIVAGSGPCSTILCIIDFAGAGAGAGAGANGSGCRPLIGQLLILSLELMLQEQEHSANGSGWCRPLPTFHWSTFYSFYLKN